MSDIEYFYGANSAFAYLGAARLMEIAATGGRRIIHRPVDLGKVVAAAYPNGFSGRSAAHRAYYFGREIDRWAQYRNVPVKGGIPSNHGNGNVLANGLLIGAVMRGHNIDRLAHAMMQAHWRDHADLADRAILADLAGAAGLDGQRLMQAADTSEVKAVQDANTTEAIERSVFGSPTYVIDGDMFYGQDHLELVERALVRPFARNWPEA